VGRLLPARRIRLRGGPAAAGGRQDRRGPQGRAALDRPVLGRQRGLARRGGRRDVRRLPGVVRQCLLGVLPRLRPAAGRVDPAWDRHRVPGQGRVRPWPTLVRHRCRGRLRRGGAAARRRVRGLPARGADERGSRRDRWLLRPAHAVRPARWADDLDAVRPARRVLPGAAHRGRRRPAGAAAHAGARTARRPARAGFHRLDLPGPRRRGQPGARCSSGRRPARGRWPRRAPGPRLRLHLDRRRARAGLGLRRAVPGRAACPQRRRAVADPVQRQLEPLHAGRHDRGRGDLPAARAGLHGLDVLGLPGPRHRGQRRRGRVRRSGPRRSSAAESARGVLGGHSDEPPVRT